jgi:hypothetical protein
LKTNKSVHLRPAGHPVLQGDFHFISHKHEQIVKCTFSPENCHILQGISLCSVYKGFVPQTCTERVIMNRNTKNLKVDVELNGVAEIEVRMVATSGSVTMLWDHAYLDHVKPVM